MEFTVYLDVEIWQEKQNKQQKSYHQQIKMLGLRIIQEIVSEPHSAIDSLLPDHQVQILTC